MSMEKKVVQLDNIPIMTSRSELTAIFDSDFFGFLVVFNLNKA